MILMVAFVAMPIVGGAVVRADESEAEISVEKQVLIKEHCGEIKDKLKALQRQDSKARVYLGKYYETMLSHFIMPLNMRLEKNGLSSLSFKNNRDDFDMVQSDFRSSYIKYQKELEKIVSMDCKADAISFYKQLVLVREKRAVVADDTAKLRKLVDKHIELVTELKEEL